MASAYVRTHMTIGAAVAAVTAVGVVAMVVVVVAVAAVAVSSRSRSRATPSGRGHGWGDSGHGAPLWAPSHRQMPSLGPLASLGVTAKLAVCIHMLHFGPGVQLEAHSTTSMHQARTPSFTIPAKGS